MAGRGCMCTISQGIVTKEWKMVTFLRKGLRRSKKPSKELYIKTYGKFCPFCGSDTLEARFEGGESPKVFFAITCNDCGETWKDMFLLVDADFGD
jgi:hypothetical protein